MYINRVLEGFKIIKRCPCIMSITIKHWRSDRTNMGNVDRCEAPPSVMNISRVGVNTYDCCCLKWR